MFPKFSDLIEYLFGIHIKLPVQTYGFFVALAFVDAAWIVWLELKRKEKEGILHPQIRKVWKGKPASIQELVTSGILGFIVGFKLLGMIMDYSYFAENPQEFILSGRGNWLGGLLLGGLSVFLSYNNKRKQRLEKPVLDEITVHPYQLTANVVLVAAIFGIIGAKIFDVFEHLDDLFSDPVGTLFSFSGLTFYGGLIVAAFAVAIYAEKNKISWPHIADIVAPGLILAYAIGRVGCHLSGDGCWGVENPYPQPAWLSFLPDWMWAFNFPHNVIDEGVRMSDCTGNHCYVLDVPVYPTSFYETVMGLVIFTVLWLVRKKLAVPGYLFSIYLILNGIERFLIEMIRVNKRYSILGTELTQAELIAIGIIILGVVGFWYFKIKEQRAKIKNQKLKA